ncbi:MAG: dehydrogenase [Deltaproteobacteria bacterium]|nr:MAG: dehydrogenase [Deltaproteobacteria bacterium]
MLCAAPLLLACDPVRALLVDVVPVSYEAAATGPTARFDVPDVPGDTLAVTLVEVAEGFPQVTDIQFPPGRSDAMVVLQKSGRATVVVGGARHRLLDLDVATRSELGLLGLAFHPRWPADPRIFVDYNPAEGPTRTRISSFVVDPDTWTASGEVVLLEEPQPYGNHDAGQLAFGPDGRLYIGLGDGGWRADPHGHGQNAATRLGSMLRIDVDVPGPGRPWSAPPDNPFVQGVVPTPETTGPVPPETFAIGLRNPWRFSFDPKGRLVVADVGQNRWEEVDLVPPGANLGWSRREGRHCFPPEVASCDDPTLTDPVFEYSHEVGASITGGYVCLADDIPALTGRYIVGDFVQGLIWALRLPDAPGQDADVLRLGSFGLLISTFGRDADGRVYVGDYGSGSIYRIGPVED